MQKQNKVNNYLKGYLEKNLDLYGLIGRSFKDIDEYSRFDKILSSLGWLGLRDRLTSLYISHGKNGVFDRSSNLAHVGEILKIESQLSQYTIDGYSRGYLLLFYFEMLKIYCEELVDDKHVMLFDKKVFDLLAYSKQRIIHIDWLVLILLHMIKYFGLEESKNLIIDGINYSFILSRFSSEQKYEFYKNISIYGASINDQTAFFDHVIE